ncbi:MAG TPA: SUMF1/EgtB/PvdO family nonheme iron enzyme [bacterium]|nr:SUMF1/EgtB/PvdO family nonheme iron enzyme [bacterium]
MAVNCPFCRYPNFADAKKCRRCGKELPHVCPECQHPLPLDAKFCSKCGFIFEQEKIDVTAYKTKSLRSRTFDEERDQMFRDERGEQSVGFKPKVHRLKKCPECWHNISEEATFCTYCGTQFTEELVKETPPTPSVSVRQPGSKKAQPAAPDAATKPAAAAKPGAVPGPAKKPGEAATAKPAGAAAKAKPVKVEAKPKPKKPPAPVPKTPLPGDIKLNPPKTAELGIKMIKVPAGAFSLPSHNGKAIASKGFYLSQAPITCTQYRKFCQATGYPAPVDWLDEAPLPDKEEHPVIMISIKDALAFCQWAGMRLPTTIEWAVAFCGQEPHRYPWGDDPQQVPVNVDAANHLTTEPVMDKTADAGPYGHHDLVGNIRQWVFDPPAKGGILTPEKIAEGKFGLAGASWLDPVWLAEYGRVDYIKDLDYRGYHIGLRVALD